MIRVVQSPSPHEFSVEHSAELDNLTNSLAAALFADMPEELARIKVERILRDEFDTRERNRGRNLYATRTFTQGEISEAVGITRYAGFGRFGAEKTRDGIKEHSRARSNKQRALAKDSAANQQRLDAIRELLP